jgi:hypothetical protein
MAFPEDSYPTPDSIVPATKMIASIMILSWLRGAIMVGRQQHTSNSRHRDCHHGNVMLIGLAYDSPKLKVKIIDFNVSGVLETQID